MPERYVEYGRRWAELNPGWKVIEWDQDSLPIDWFYNKVVWDMITENGTNPGAYMPPDQAIAVQHADVAGYELVYTYGGIYVNCDIEPVRSLDPWIADVVCGRAFAGYEDQRFLVNAVLGGPPRHRFWRTVIEALEPRYRLMPGQMMNMVTGPYLLTDVHSTWGDPSSFYAVPREVFNPIHHGSIPAGGYVTGFNPDDHLETIAVHHWGHRLTAT